MFHLLLDHLCLRELPSYFILRGNTLTLLFLLSSAKRVCVYMWVYLNLCIHVCVSVCVDQKLISGTVPQGPFTLFCETGSLS